MKINIIEDILKEIESTSSQETQLYREDKKYLEEYAGVVTKENTKKIYNYSLELEGKLLNLISKALVIALDRNSQFFIKKLQQIAAELGCVLAHKRIVEVLLSESLKEELRISCYSVTHCNFVRIIKGWNIVKPNCSACITKRMSKVLNEDIDLRIFGSISNN